MAGGGGGGVGAAVDGGAGRGGPSRGGGGGADEEVAGDVLEVAAEAQPLAGGRDVVGGALALGLHQHGQLDVVLAVPRRERLEQLQALAVRVDDDLHARSVFRRSDETLGAGLEATCGQRLAAGV